MAKKDYLVTSEEGAAWAGVEEGETVSLDLDPERELPLVAAGWLEPVAKKETPKKKEEG